MTSRTTASRVRRDFLDFFVERGHREVPSSPVFPKDDPTLLFTNAGMNQFKDVFLGTGRRDYARAVDTQKCIRASGKHNDLEDVGRDTYHHTFFEMLGNWSFGDYFKEEAIVWAWELLTGVWGLSKERLWATVFAGDEAAGLGPDEEAERIWREKTDIDPGHVLRFDKHDNFWEMGATGPCGPCSEIHIDRGGDGTDPRDGADRGIGVNAGNERFIELWNLVFMQYDRRADGALAALPARSVDTGMGFERVLSVLQGRSSNYDTDLFQPLFGRIAELTGRRYGVDEETDVAFRVCADHMRAVTAAFADGALPSNEGRGYVLRRLVRRASRFGRQTLGQERPFLFELAPAVAEVLGEAFPEMRERVEHVQLLVESEEEAFGKTLDRGLLLFEGLAARVEATGGGELPGDETFELYATFGFPKDLVELMARERGLGVDEQGWAAAEAAHRAVSRSEGKFQPASTEAFAGLEPTVSTYHDAGRPGYELETVVEYVGRGVGGPRDVGMILRESPFYPEAGGQIGDAGRIEAADGSFTFRVDDTRKTGDFVVHLGAFAHGEPAGGLGAAKGRAVRALVDRERRDRTRKNHTATHLLHKALRDVLGEHVTQQGSYVGPDRLRFDLSHPRAITPQELELVEREVSARIFANEPLDTTVEDLDEARARGVMALFGEKYDQRVRVVTVGDSCELCGGTHVRAAGDIGPFLIVSESSIQAGVRRIEAITGPAAVEAIQEQRRLLEHSAHALKVKPSEVPERIVALQTQVKEAKKQKKAAAGADVASALQEIKGELAERNGVLAGVVVREDLDAGALRQVGERVKSLAPDLAVAVFGREGDKVPFLVFCLGKAQDLGLGAGVLAKGIATHLGGGGGGRPDVAQGQGLDAAGLGAARDYVAAELGRTLGLD